MNGSDISRHSLKRLMVLTLCEIPDGDLKARVCCPRPGHYFIIFNEVASLNQTEIDCSSAESNSQAKSAGVPYSS